jgi:hypothetical protein
VKTEISATRMLATLTFVGVGAVLFLSGCSTTVASTPAAATAVEAGEALPPAVTSFMGADSSKLEPGPEGGAALVYVNKNAQWSKYAKIQLQPVEFWAGGDSTVSPSDQQTLTTYTYNALKADLEKHYTLVNQPGPDTMTLKVALMDATTATPGLRSVSVVVPQLKVLNMAQSMVTGSYAFVGSAEAEMKATDSTTGELLAAAVDKRAGGAGIKGAASFKWGDAQNAMDYWADRVTTRLLQLQGRAQASLGGRTRSS